MVGPCNRQGLCLTFVQCPASVHLDLKGVDVGDIEGASRGSRRSVRRSGDSNSGGSGGWPSHRGAERVAAGCCLTSSLALLL